jgi:hypothetical protein
MGVRKEKKGIGEIFINSSAYSVSRGKFKTVGPKVTLQNKVAYSFFKRYGFRDVYHLMRLYIVFFYIIINILYVIKRYIF